MIQRFLTFVCGLCLLLHYHTYAMFDWYNSFVYMPFIKRTNNALMVQGLSHYRPMHAYDEQGQKQLALQVYSKTEDSLSALEGFPSDSIQAQLLHALDVETDAFRGKITLDGNLHLRGGLIFGASIPLGKSFFWRSILGWYTFALSDFSYVDNTKYASFEDERVHALLTDSFVENTKRYGNNLALDNWRSMGVGDWVNYIVWEKDFEQYKAFLSNVQLSIRTGLIVPTGKKQDTEKLMHAGYGYSGSWGIPLGAQLHFDLCSFAACGIDFELTYLFGKSAAYRFKTARHQTDLLLFAKERGYKEFGMHQRLDLYMQLFDPKKQVSCTLGYHYHKKGNDTLVIDNAPFVNTHANQALAMQDGTIHCAMVALAVDGSSWFERAYPEGNIFIKIPFNGSNRIASSVIGWGFSVNF